MKKAPLPQVQSGPHEIPGLLALYAGYAVYIIIHDWLCCFGGLSASVWSYLGALAIFALVLAAGVLWNRRTQSVRFTWPKLSRWDWLVFAIFLLMFLLRVGRADSASDTRNYHIVNQADPFRDHTGYDFFPGRRETFFPALADRMYYPFRLLLGYRVGTILYTLLMMLTYLGVKRLVRKGLAVPGKPDGKHEALLSLACGAVLISNFVCQEICSYLVDLFPLPLMLYLICEIAGEGQTDRRGDVFLALCVGLVVALKMSYVFMLLPLGVWYLWTNRERVTPALLLLFAVLGLLPVLVYLVNTWKQTGNPVFPHFNTVFHSPYLTDRQNEVLNLSRVNGLLDGLLRPFWWAIASPDNAASSGFISSSDCRITLGLISSLTLLVFRVGDAESRRRLRPMAALHVIMVYLTVFLIDAYPRLSLIIEPFGSAMTLLLIALCWRSPKRPRLQKALAGIAAVLLGSSVAYAGGLYLMDNAEYSWGYTVLSPEGTRTRNGMPLLFRDRVCTPEEQAITGQVKVWLSFDVMSGPMRLLNEDAPIINSYYARFDENRQAAAERLLQQYGETGLYTVSYGANLPGTLTRMTSEGYRVSGEIQMVHPYFSDVKLYLIPVERSQTANEYAQLSETVPSVTEELPEKRTLERITCYAGLSSIADTLDVAWQPVTLRFSLVSGDTAAVLAETAIEPDFEYHLLELPCSAEANPGDQILVEALGPDGNPYGYFVDLVNLSVA